MSDRNSAGGICRLAQTGARFSDVDAAVDQARQFPGITGFGAAWQLAGGQFDASGLPIGVTKPLTPGELAKVIKRPQRLLEAVDKGKLRKGPATVRQQTKATGFYLPDAPDAGRPRLRPPSQPAPVAASPANKDRARQALAQIRESLK